MFCLLTLVVPGARGESYRLASPDGQIQVAVEVGQQVRWSATHAGVDVLAPSRLALTLDNGESLGESPQVVSAETQEIRETVRPVVPTKAAELADHCNQLTLNCQGGYSIQFRVYDTGAAYRFATDRDGQIRVQEEIAEFRFAEDCLAYFPEEDSMLSHYERLYKPLRLDEISDERFCSLPMLLKTSDDVFVALTDADLYDYPAMFLAGTGRNQLSATFPRAVLAAVPAKQGPDRNQQITREADYLAETAGRRVFPWRVVMLARRIGALIEDDLVFKLSRPLEIEEPGWIKPGKVAWDWWNANNLFGVDFAAGINTDTYRYYIDFAADYGLEYIILDEGWSKSTTELLESKPDVDVQALVRYGREKHVGVILWTLWKPLDQDLERVLDTWAGWGVQGIKVDFMQRADQQMVNFYERTARAAAQRQLLVDYHGAFKPSGLRRACPNVISYEGVKGLENCKWSADITPEHDVTLPFTRMLAGPMDFTPGAMRNAQQENFAERFTRPMSQGTRCHQAAMYVIYESPLQMLSDTPSNYLQEPEYTRFIARIPTTWDASRVLEAAVGDYIVMARRKGDTWYVAAMTDWEPRTFAIDLSFLGDGTWTLASLQDGINAARHACDYRLSQQDVSAEDPLPIELAPGGGWTGILQRKSP
jgi:alpha-glucosidase